jgi:hypothetical protein
LHHQFNLNTNRQGGKRKELFPFLARYRCSSKGHGVLSIAPTEWKVQTQYGPQTTKKFGNPTYKTIKRLQLAMMKFDLKIRY